MASSTEEVNYLTLLKNGNFLRFFLAQFVSSLGDWVGVIAIAVFARNLAGDAAVGAVMTARVLPGFVMGPIGGVIADRWDRKRAMVGADVLRAVIIFSVPFVPNLLYLLLASVVLESLTLIWGPAKDASLPHFVPAQHLTHANSLSLIAIYGPWPLASVLFASLAAVGGFLGEHVPVLSGLQPSAAAGGGPIALALWADSLTFAFSAIMISTLAIASSRRRAAKFDLAEVKRDLVEGLRFVRDHRQVRPWLLGIAFTFTAAGGVFSLGVGFVEDVLGGSETGFAFLIGFLATGMIVGLLAAGLLAKMIQKDVLFSTSILLLGIGLIGLAAMGSLNPAIPIASALGFFGGVAYATGYSLIQLNTEDEIRGRTFSAGYTVIRIGILVGLGLFPFVAGAIGDHALQFPGGEYPLPGTRITLWFAGAFVLGGGLLSMRAIRHREKGPERRHGYFVVFEGGEGAGKSTQIEALVRWLEARGEKVVVTREPGGTSIGARIRELLLDPAASEMEPRAEALLYAADRAQHVAEVVSPALEQGAVVVSDRFVDSSLAYQGVARDLGQEDIYNISAWATGGLIPDLVFFLKVDSETGLGRAGGSRDRIEREAAEFHDRVSDAYLDLAERFPDRFVVLDGDRHPDEIHKEVIAIFEERTAHLPTGVRPRGTVPR
ncbi:MAG: dTMP kinase [Actinomycetota bacterium]